jgi:hypothetical protein
MNNQREEAKCDELFRREKDIATAKPQHEMCLKEQLWSNMV